MAVPLIINGKDVVTDTLFDVHSPSQHKVIYQSSSSSVKHAVEAVESSQAAFAEWSALNYAVRRDYLMKTATVMENRKAEAWKYVYEETGAPEAMFNFTFDNGVGMLRDIAGRLSSIEGSVPTVAEPGSSAMIIKEPYGVILGISPWNAPFVLGIRAVAYAIATGNTCILKGSEASPKCYWFLADIYREAGLPAGVVNMLLHRPEDAAQVTNELVAHPAIRKVNFTGSTAVGSIIASLAGKHLKPVLMELGGKAPTLVLEGADFEKAAIASCVGAFLHGGQICMSTERIIVVKAVYEPFKAALVSKLQGMFGANAPAPYLFNATPVTKNKSLIKDAESKGANIIYAHADDADSLPKTQMRPVVIENPSRDSTVFHTESFGPTVSLFVVDTEDEAIALANDTDYGLSSAVFTEDLRRGLRVAKRIESGAVHINSMSVHDEPVLPHGGVKKSGWGRFNGAAGFDEFLKTKTITWKD